MREREKDMNGNSRKAFKSISLRARVLRTGRQNDIVHAVSAMRRLTKAMQRTAQGKPIRGWSWRNITGKMTAPTLEPIAAIPMARGRFVVKLVDTTASAGM